MATLNPIQRVALNDVRSGLRAAALDKHVELWRHATDLEMAKTLDNCANATCNAIAKALRAFQEVQRT